MVTPEKIRCRDEGLPHRGSGRRPLARGSLRGSRRICAQDPVAAPDLAHRRNRCPWRLERDGALHPFRAYRLGAISGARLASGVPSGAHPGQQLPALPGALPAKLGRSGTRRAPAPPDRRPGHLLVVGSRHPVDELTPANRLRVRPDLARPPARIRRYPLHECGSSGGGPAGGTPGRGDSPQPAGRARCRADCRSMSVEEDTRSDALRAADRRVQGRGTARARRHLHHWHLDAGAPRGPALAARASRLRGPLRHLDEPPTITPSILRAS